MRLTALNRIMGSKQTQAKEFYKIVLYRKMKNGFRTKRI